MTTHACNGSFTIIVFASSIIINSGSNFSPEFSFSFPLISILAASISMNCIDRFGRKPILCTCFTMITVAMTCIGTVVLIQHHGGTVPFWIPLTAMMMAVAGHAAGPLAVAYVVLSEMFNFQVRAKLMGFNVSYTWFMNFIQLFIFAPISDSLGLYTAFYIYAVFNILAMLFSLVILPETKGKSIEEIEEHLKKKYNLKN
ncbi:solute carrier family 2, facilitated glucose transporter member 8-like [Hyposmocoma kahamanoa]|uniref:solute carrier family 2, facilitated glucose transporter member 8-like n=1 Tax=Hyposmocoma kahamanoa TaxID=1477025 RepID=UPI000E6D8426|nr:solute carrier family 2, facilitated glucose transporter member 8-like [Hyposmocoma kahamanoa]